MAAGGAAGALARYWVGIATHARAGSFPWPTLLINVSGSLALGLLVARTSSASLARPLLGVGFLGAFTTMSTFAVETDLLVKDGRLLVAVAYVGASLVGGVAACALGRRSGSVT
ncbi:MAG: fluoride exporter [Acidimicrobiaceae bacterium]|nr:fluoride exporter [Acidimicrobiaceae bacterium]